MPYFQCRLKDIYRKAIREIISHSETKPEFISYSRTFTYIRECVWQDDAIQDNLHMTRLSLIDVRRSDGNYLRKVTASLYLPGWKEIKTTTFLSTAVSSSLPAMFCTVIVPYRYNLAGSLPSCESGFGCLSCRFSSIASYPDQRIPFRALLLVLIVIFYKAYLVNCSPLIGECWDYELGPHI